LWSTQDGGARPGADDSATFYDVAMDLVARPLRVAALELPARWNEPARALDETRRLLADGPPPDIALLPEAAITGYVSPRRDFDLRPFAEPLAGPTAAALSEIAREARCWLAGPLVEQDGERTYNATVVFDAQGALVAHYRKRHPWYPETWATPGDAPPPIFEVHGARVTLAVCFDLQFVAEDAADALREADVLLFPSAWVERHDTRGPTLEALARRFDVAVVNANWGEGSPRVPGQGRSRIVVRDGRTVAVANGAGRIDAHLAEAGVSSRP
jgi:predicted amidohydrolase